jgi:hypothetical protein
MQQTIVSQMVHTRPIKYNPTYAVTARTITTPDSTYHFALHLRLQIK